METHVGFILDPWHFASRQSFGIQHMPHTGTGKRLFVQRPLAQSYEPMNRSLRSLPAMHNPGPNHRHSPANRLTSFEKCHVRGVQITSGCPAGAQRSRCAP